MKNWSFEIKLRTQFYPKAKKQQKVFRNYDKNIDLYVLDIKTNNDEFF